MKHIGLGFIILAALSSGLFAADESHCPYCGKRLPPTNYSGIIENQKQTIGNLERSVRDLQAKNKTLTDKLAKAEKERDDAKALAKASPMGQAQDTIKNLSEQNKALDLKVRTLEPTVASLQKEIARLRGLTQAGQATSRPTSQPASLPVR
jgi:predicted RNase H-like nuclease (RuvC/YqgF family)